MEHNQQVRISGAADRHQRILFIQCFLLGTESEEKGGRTWAAYRFDSGGGRPSNNVVKPHIFDLSRRRPRVS